MRRIFVFILTLLLSTQGFAQSTYDFVLNGRLTESNGKPVDGPIAMQVKFFHAATGGNSVLTVTTGLESVTLQEGVFHIKLTLDASDYHAVFPSVATAAYFEVTDLTNAATTPYERTQISMVPYAAKVPVDTGIFGYNTSGKLTLASPPESSKYLKGNADGSVSWDSPGSAGSSETYTNKTINADNNTITNIADANIKASAAIADSKLATISTAGKVSGAAITSGTIAGTTAVSTSGPIATTGKAGIGAAAGTSQLEVKGGGATSATSALNVMDSAGSSKLFVRDDGNVGIGTTSPAQKLDVVGNIATSGTLKVGTTASAPYIQTDASTGDLRLGAYATDTLKVNAGAVAVNASIDGAIGLNVAPSSAGFVGLAIKRFNAASTGNIQEWRNESSVPHSVVTASGLFGIGTRAPINPLSASPVQYSTGTASQSTTTVTGVGTTWTSAMIGSQLVFANGTSAGTITAFGSTTSLTVSVSQTVTSQAYTIHYPGLNVTSTGNVGIGTTAPTAGLHILTAGAASQPGQRIDGAWYTAGTATTNKPQFLLEPAGTTSTAWSTGGTGLGINAASGFAGNLLDTQVAGVTKSRITTDGDVFGRYAYFSQMFPGTIQMSAYTVSITTSLIGLSNASALRWSSGTQGTGSYDTSLYRDGVGVLSQRDSTTAQAFKVYGTYTDASNYVRGSLTSNGTSSVTLAAETAGTGADNIDLILTPAGTGYVGIGTTSPSQKLTVGASGDGSVALANAWNTFSDIRLKKGMTKIEDALDKVAKLAGYFFFWKSGKDNSRQMGVVAQEIEKVFPEIVTTNRDGLKSVDYPKLAVPMIEAIKTLKKQNEKLEADNEVIRADNVAMKKVLCELRPVASFCID